MEKKDKMKLPKSIERLANILPEDLYIVGGKVRSFLMGEENSDIDLCSSLTLYELDKIFDGKNYSLEGRDDVLGTAKIVCGDEKFDYATFRREEYGNKESRKPTYVEFIERVEEDCFRRDFTINALYYNIKTGEILDFCGGISDVKNKIIRCVKDPYIVMADDGVRILRMVRIASELNFSIEKNTFNAAKFNSRNLRNLSSERIIIEILKLLNSDSKYSKVKRKNLYLKGVKLFNKMGLWKRFGLSFDRLKIHMIKKEKDKKLGLLIDIIDSERPASISYSVEKILEKVQLPKKDIARVTNIISGYYDALNRTSNKEYFAKYFDNFDAIYKILSPKSKSLALKYMFFYKYIISHKIVVRTADLKITNKDLKKNFPSLPKKSYPVILNMVLSDIFEGKYSNETDVILQEIEKKLKYY